MKSARTKATDIPRKVKEAVFERDNGCCIWCGRPGIPNAHCTPRSKGGLGIEENVLTLCVDCHHRYDNGNGRAEMQQYFMEYLKRKYPNWNEEKLIYKKW